MFPASFNVLLLSIVVSVHTVRFNTTCYTENESYNENGMVLLLLINFTKVTASFLASFSVLFLCSVILAHTIILIYNIGSNTTCFSTLAIVSPRYDIYLQFL